MQIQTTPPLINKVQLSLGYCAGFGGEVRNTLIINGAPVSFRAIRIEGSIDALTTVTVEFAAEVEGLIQAEVGIPVREVTGEDTPSDVREFQPTTLADCPRSEHPAVL